jgi:hypothetical protein
VVTDAPCHARGHQAVPHGIRGTDSVHQIHSVGPRVSYRALRVGQLGIPNIKLRCSTAQCPCGAKPDPVLTLTVPLSWGS